MKKLKERKFSRLATSAVLGPYGPIHIIFPGPIMIFIKDFEMVISKITGNEDQERIKGLIKLSSLARIWSFPLVLCIVKFDQILTVREKNKQYLGEKSATNFAIHLLLFTD